MASLGSIGLILATALLAACMDVAVSFFGTPEGLSGIREILVVVGCSFLLFLVISLATFWVRGFYVRGRIDRDTASFSIFTAVLVVTFAGSSSFFELNRPSTITQDPASLLALILLCLWLATPVLVLAKWISRRESGVRLDLGFRLMAPGLAVTTLGLAWIRNYRSGLLMAQDWVILGLLLLVLTALLFASHHFSKNLSLSRPLTRLVSGLIILVPGFALIPLLEREPERTPVPDLHPIRHVFLITVDTLRADALDTAGPLEATSTPTFHRFAQDSVVFEKALSPAPWTRPAVASIMTGTTPRVHGTVGIDTPLPRDLVTLAEYMSGAGYRTHAIGRNVHLVPQFLFDQGFDTYQFFPRPSLGTSAGALIAARLFPSTYRHWSTTATLTNDAMQWVRAHRDEPFFLWLHYFDPHTPYEPPPELLPHREGVGRIGLRYEGGRESGFPSREERAWIRELYNAEVRLVDGHIGRLVQTLQQLDIYDDSLIVLSSDHGEEFWEHGETDHGHSVYNELLRVPLMFKLPGPALRASVVQPVSTAAILPTVLDLCRIPYDDQRLAYSSLSDFLKEGPVAEATSPIVSSGVLYKEDRVSVVTDHFKYIRSRETRQEELYDLATDPGEHRSQVEGRPTWLQRGRMLVAEHEALAAHLREGITQSTVTPSREATEQLRALGYVH